MKTYDELREQFEKDVKDLQSKCKHPQISDWCEHQWAIAHGSGFMVKYCKICQKFIQYKSQCIACGSEIISNEAPNIYQDSHLCDSCKKKGNHFCFQHKFFHNNQYGCPKCLKDFRD